jgi:formylglycine-generating enzyme required for sulfatase activity
MFHDVRVRLLLLSFVIGCAAQSWDSGDTVSIAPGSFTMGSSLHARAQAIDEAARHGADVRTARARVNDELPSTTRKLGGYAIMIHPVTQAEYATYVYETGAAEPWVDARTWSRTPHAKGEDPQRVAWRSGRPQDKRMDQPAVLVSQPEAEAYCAMWGERNGGIGMLPTEAQWERAARGDDGRAYPWGSTFVVGHGNTRESGRGDMIAVASSSGAVSPHGVHDMGGNVAEWTREIEDGDAIVKGGAWSDDLIAARAAARRHVPAAVRHVAVGFRCVLDRPAK